jgi:ubiquinone biosynthesis protein
MSLSQELDDLKRGKQIIDVFLKNGLGHYVKPFGFKGIKIGKSKVPQTNDLPRLLRLSFEELGGTFIKLGQLLSLRPDLIPKEYCDEFQLLQDKVKPFEYQTAKKIIEDELKAPISKHFMHIEKRPLAAASVGQVHRAKLVSGEEVVIKIQRPGIRKEMESDLDILHTLAKLAKDKLNPKVFDPLAIVEEFEEYTGYELDYNHEARNVELIHNNFQNRKTKIPKVYSSLCTDKILVLEYIDGQKLKDAKLSGAEIEEVSKALYDTILRQIFIDGIFHADPHPGNILVVGNSIALIDFGIVGYLDEVHKEKLIDMMVAILDRDIEALTEAMMELGAAHGEVNPARIKEDISANLAKYYDSSVKDIRISQALLEAIQVAKRNNIMLPKNLVLLAKCMITTESVILKINPNFNPIANARPFAREVIQSRYHPSRIIRDMQKSTRKIKSFLFRLPQLSENVAHGLEQGEYYVKRIHKDMALLTREINSSSNRLSLAMIATALIIASAFLLSVQGQNRYSMPIIPSVGFACAGVLVVILVVTMFSENQKV